MANVISEEEFIWKTEDVGIIILSIRSPNGETYFDLWHGVNGDNDFCLVRECDENGNMEECFQLTFKESFIILSTWMETDEDETQEILLDTLTNILNNALVEE